MLKIFLVEDEVIIRDGIKNSIDWASHGYEFAGEASDGELAWPMIKELEPDILITDIRMPFMDGLELSGLVKKDFPQMKIIILSGYNEFEYAKQAINIGVTDYLSKPISSEKLLEAIERVAGIIRKEQDDKALLARYVKEMQENKEYEKYQLFNRLLDGTISMTEALERGEALGMDLGAKGYCVILFKIMTTEHKMDYNEELIEAQSRIEEFAENEPDILWCRRGSSGWAFIMQGVKGDEMKNRTGEFVENLQEMSRGYSNLEHFGAIGCQVDRLRMLKDSYEEAERAFANRFIMDKSDVLWYDKVQNLQLQENIRFQGLGTVDKSREMLGKFLRSGTQEEVHMFIQVYFEALHENDLQSLMFRQYIVMDAFICILTLGESLHISKEELDRELGDVNEVPQYIGNLDTTKMYLEKIVDKMIMLRDKTSESRYSDIVGRARRYIQENYMTETISLNTVSASVNMSPSYFSAVFSQEAGQTFVEYLTDVRMDRAKELLMCSDKRTSDIGYEIGYKDAHYFSYIFKKTQGCSPKEYRARGKA